MFPVFSVNSKNFSTSGESFFDSLGFNKSSILSASKPLDFLINSKAKFSLRSWTSYSSSSCSSVSVSCSSTSVSVSSTSNSVFTTGFQKFSKLPFDSSSFGNSMLKSWTSCSSLFRFSSKF